MFILKSAKEATNPLYAYAMSTRFRLVHSTNPLIAYAIRTREVNISTKTTEAERAKFFASSSQKPDSVEDVRIKLLPKYYDYIDLFSRRAVE